MKKANRVNIHSQKSEKKGEGVMQLVEYLKDSKIVIRHMVIRDVVWMAGVDVCNAMGWQNARVPLSRHVGSENKMKLTFPTAGGNQNITAINEQACYELALRSKSAWAEEFKHKLTNELLPSVRQAEQSGMPTTLSAIASSGDGVPRVERILILAERVLSVGDAMQAENSVDVAVDTVKEAYGVDLRKIFKKKRVVGRKYYSRLDFFVVNECVLEVSEFVFFSEFFKEYERCCGKSLSPTVVGSYLGNRFEKVRIDGKIAYMGIKINAY